MAKKQVKIYISDENIAWINSCPAARTTSGSVTLLTEWAIKQIQHGAVTAIEKLDEAEQKTIIAFAKTHEITSDVSPATLVIALGKWFRFSAQRPFVVRHLDKYKFNALMTKCGEMSPAEVIGLLLWARGSWNTEEAEEAYIANP